MVFDIDLRWMLFPYSLWGGKCFYSEGLSRKFCGRSVVLRSWPCARTSNLYETPYQCNTHVCMTMLFAYSQNMYNRQYKYAILCMLLYFNKPNCTSATLPCRFGTSGLETRTGSGVPANGHAETSHAFSLGVYSCLIVSLVFFGLCRFL